MLLDISIWAEGGVATGEEETNFLGLPLPLADLLLPPELSLGLFSLPLLLLAITDQWSQEIIRKVYGASQLRVFGDSNHGPVLSQSNSSPVFVVYLWWLADQYN